MTNMSKGKELDIRIIELYEENRSILENKGRKAQIDLRKKEAWESITLKINAEFGVQLTTKKVEDKWRYLKRTSKKANATHVRAKQRTGGGPPPKPLTETNEKVVNVLGKTVGFRGIAGGMESTVADLITSNNTNDVGTSSDPGPTNREHQNTSIPDNANETGIVALGTDENNDPINLPTNRQVSRKKSPKKKLSQEDILLLQEKVLKRDLELQEIKFRLFSKAEKFFDIKLAEFDRDVL